MDNNEDDKFYVDDNVGCFGMFLLISGIALILPVLMTLMISHLFSIKILLTLKSYMLIFGSILIFIYLVIALTKILIKKNYKK